jgi:hypothetical protein
MANTQANHPEISATPSLSIPVFMVVRAARIRGRVGWPLAHQLVLTITPAQYQVLLGVRPLKQLSLKEQASLSFAEISKRAEVE